jgi:ElaB/YqjD/DUF883 family membrane-anchored ribosome-binding protein
VEGGIFGLMNTSEVTNRLKGWQEEAGRMAVTAGKSTDHAVRENTWAAIGIAAVIGCLLGYLLANTED